MGAELCREPQTRSPSEEGFASCAADVTENPAVGVAFSDSDPSTMPARGHRELSSRHIQGEIQERKMKDEFWKKRTTEPMRTTRCTRTVCPTWNWKLNAEVPRKVPANASSTNQVSEPHPIPSRHIMRFSEIQQYCWLSVLWNSKESDDGAHPPSSRQHPG